MNTPDIKIRRSSFMNTRSKKMLIAMAVVTAICSPATYAQDLQEDNSVLEEVMVTGSRIRSPNDESVSPITSIGADEFEAYGILRTEDLMNTLPQVYAAQAV